MDKEQIYDAKIDPLMAQVIAICQEHKIALVASFAIPNEDEPDLRCTTALTNPEFDPPQEFKDCVKILFTAQIQPLMLRTQHGDGSQTLTAIMP